MINLNCLMDYIWYQIFKIISSIFKKKLDNSSIRKYVNKIENRITFKIKSGYYLELSTPETVTFFGSIGNKINKDKKGENVPHAEIIQVVLVYSNIVNNGY